MVNIERIDRVLAGERGGDTNRNSTGAPIQDGEFLSFVRLAKGNYFACRFTLRSITSIEAFVSNWRSDRVATQSDA